ncbi:MAG: ABC transporter permease [Gammaproteobacteria bacterium]|nr:ABC transporter permease [Gammaproteobacteria bacterium]
MSKLSTINNANSVRPAFEELAGIFSGWRVWITLAWDDIRLRYRRSSLGPFWITLSMAIKIYFMGFLYGHLFKVDTSQYFPFLASGIIVWTTVGALINDSSLVFIESETYLRNMKISYLHLILRVIVRNIIIFAHNILAYVPVIIYFASGLNNFSIFNLLLFLPNLIIVLLMFVFITSIIAIIGTRFRDMQLIIDSVLQVVFFMTPIMWLPSLLPDRYQWLVMVNPFYHIVNLIRAPLLGQQVELTSYAVVLIFSFFSFIVFYYLINRCKYRIIFWL